MAAARLVPVQFGDFLVERKVLTEAQLLDALADHWVSGRKIGESIVAKGFVSAERVAELQAEFDNLSTVFV
jgi:hypothetical protein